MGEQTCPAAATATATAPTVVCQQFTFAELDNFVEYKVKLYFATESFPTFNFIGRLIGRGGENLQTIEADCECRLSILGRGSLRSKDEERRMEPLSGYEHLREPLHILIVCCGLPHHVYQRISRALCLLKPYLHPDTAINVQPHRVAKTSASNPQQRFYTSDMIVAPITAHRLGVDNSLSTPLPPPFTVQHQRPTMNTFAIDTTAEGALTMSSLPRKLTRDVPQLHFTSNRRFLPYSRMGAQITKAPQLRGGCSTGDEQPGSLD